MAPVLVFWRKIHVGQMASDTGHGNRASPPWLAKVKVKRIILDILVAGIVLFQEVSCVLAHIHT